MSEEEQKKPSLGFGDSPDSLTMIFVGGGDDDDEEGGAPWYTRDFDRGVNHPIPSSAITGYVYGLKLSFSEYKKKRNYKLNIRLNADKRYQIRSGLNTLFSRGFLLAFERFLDDGNDPKKNPLTITVRKGNEGNVVFCSVFTPEDNRKVFVEWDGERNLFKLVQDLQAQLGVTVQTKDMVDNPDKYKDQEYASKPKLSDDDDDDDAPETLDDDDTPKKKTADEMADEIFGKQAAAPAATKKVKKSK